MGRLEPTDGDDDGGRELVLNPHTTIFIVHSVNMDSKVWKEVGY